MAGERVALAVLALAACAPPPRANPAGGPAPAPGLAYSSPNGLITIHYPDGFKAEVVGKSALELARSLSDGRDEALTFVSIETPVSDDLKEFDRVTERANTDRLYRYEETSKTSTLAHGTPAVETEGYWFLDSGIRCKRHAWNFLRNGHGYSFSYLVPEEDAAEQEPALRTIIDATEFIR